MNLKALFPRASKTFYEINDSSEVPNPVPQPNQASALDSANEGKVSRVRRVRVRFIGYRVRPLDPDNFAGSCKDLLDGLRHAQLIHGDEPWRIDFQTAQEKVKSYATEKTVIEITYAGCNL